MTNVVTLPVELTVPVSTDLLHAVDDPAGSAADAKLQIGNIHLGMTAASETVASKVELATSAEVVTGTDTARAVTPAGAAAAYKAIVAIYNTATAQSIPNNTLTILNFDTLVNDTDTAVTTGASWKFTAPASKFYRIDIQMMFSTTTGWADGEKAEIDVYIDGVVESLIDRKDNYNSASPYMQLSGGSAYYMTAGQYLDVRVLQLSGGTLTLYTDAAFNRIAITSL